MMRPLKRYKERKTISISLQDPDGNILYLNLEDQKCISRLPNEEDKLIHNKIINI